MKILMQLLYRDEEYMVNALEEVVYKDAKPGEIELYKAGFFANEPHYIAGRMLEVDEMGAHPLYEFGDVERIDDEQG